MNALLTQVDLSSLEEIRGGGVYLTRNPNLCYFGDLVRYINGSYHSCVDETGRKDPDQCCKCTGLLINKLLLLFLLL